MLDTTNVDQDEISDPPDFLDRDFVDSLHDSSQNRYNSEEICA